MATEAVKITYVEAAAPSTPAASRTVTYAKADGLMYSKDDAGVETLMSGGSSGAVATDAIWDAKGDIAVATAANTAAKLTVGSNGQVLTADSGETTGAKWATPSSGLTADLLPWNIDVIPIFVKANTNWSSLAGIDGTNVMNFGRESSGAQNAEVTWDVVLAAGTWRVDVAHIKGTDRGIISVQFDTVEKGTIDTYNGSLARNQLGSVTGINVPTTAKIELKLKMATKNGSSSSYYGTINLVTLRRTA